MLRPLVSKARFQYVSDLHLDLYKRGSSTVWSTLLAPSAPRLILAGDIAQLTWKPYSDFLAWCGKQWKDVFLVPGNHEYYGTSVVQGDQDLKKWLKDLPNVHLLKNRHLFLTEQDEVVDQESSDTRVHLLGCTLWSHIPPEAARECTQMLSDFYAISDMNLSMYNFWHAQDRKWLHRELELVKSSGKPAIVVTHHAPLLKGVSHPQYEVPDRGFNCAFCTDLSEEIAMLPACSHWIYGHTHWRTQFQLENCTVSSNALGYPSDKYTVDYKPTVVEISPTSCEVTE